MLHTLLTSLLATTALAQTYTSCNPLFQTCKPDPALGGARDFEFSSPQPDWHVSFKPDRVEYTKNDGVSLRVQNQGDNPTLESDFYIMFGKVEAVIKAAPGVGIVSSFVLQSDDLDEIDWEWIGGNNFEVQSNYFVKGNTETYDRGQFHQIHNPIGEFHTYTLEWTSEHITWAVNGQVIRTLPFDNPNGFPQSPMNLRMGVWAGGDPTNNPGTIQWAGGLTDYSAGPYPMYIKSVNVEDYSTGSAYVYSDHTGTWQSIKAIDGKVNPVRPAVIPKAGNAILNVVEASSEIETKTKSETKPAEVKPETKTSSSPESKKTSSIPDVTSIKVSSNAKNSTSTNLPSKNSTVSTKPTLDILTTTSPKPTSAKPTLDILSTTKPKPKPTSLVPSSNKTTSIQPSPTPSTTHSVTHANSAVASTVSLGAVLLAFSLLLI